LEEAAVVDLPPGGLDPSPGGLDPPLEEAAVIDPLSRGLARPWRRSPPRAGRRRGPPPRAGRRRESPRHKAAVVREEEEGRRCEEEERERGGGAPVSRAVEWRRGRVREDR
jgi:hypothetical protein